MRLGSKLGGKYLLSTLRSDMVGDGVGVGEGAAGEGGVEERKADGAGEVGESARRAVCSKCSAGERRGWGRSVGGEEEALLERRATVDSASWQQLLPPLRLLL